MRAHRDACLRGTVIAGNYEPVVREFAEEMQRIVDDAFQMPDPGSLGAGVGSRTGARRARTSRLPSNVALRWTCAQQTHMQTGQALHRHLNYGAPTPLREICRYVTGSC